MISVLIKQLGMQLFCEKANHSTTTAYSSAQIKSMIGRWIDENRALKSDELEQIKIICVRYELPCFIEEIEMANDLKVLEL